MKKPIVSIFASALFVFGTHAFAQQAETSTEQKTETVTNTPEGKTHSKSHALTGRVKSFEAGKKIEVTTARNKERSFDLDDKNTTYDVAADVSVGQKVEVLESTDASGQKTVTIKPVSKMPSSRHRH
jgi:hypothetical protein